MSSERRTSILLDELPDPTLAYTIEADDARITATNNAFSQQFETELSGALISTIFDRFNKCNTTGDKEPLTHLLQGDQVGVRLSGYNRQGPFFARIIPSDDDTGYIIFSDLRKCPDRGESPGIDQVSSVISHDLRNPLDVAKAHLQAAQETGDAEHFQSVANAHDRMEQIIRDVLTLTRDDIVIQPSEEVAVEATATDAWESIDTEHVELTVSEALPTVTADPDRLRRLFENLFRNTVEHTIPSNQSEPNQKTDPTDEKSSNSQENWRGDGVTVTVQPFEDGFYIADNGPGIPAAERNVAFNPGYSTRSGGTGLGLAIVKQIIEAHDWEVTLTVADCGGAKFEINI
ncbi:HTR-like protein [Halorubrum coriense DSM 10284]|uniref:histidine kinase n=1 Tax=Halorubrum coriense DSM 10284 TaxID=1227466 RepID=M0ERQ4_9EURY|nr:HAMP domain-containing sensor histidine kinase [Halorubrum coriense]ELZ50481.1 HTR-like protein [Halorubrum coriense DSM 10284]